MDDYISRSAFIEAKEKQYCQNCDRRKNSKGQVVYSIGDAPCRACGIRDVLDDVEDFPAADVRSVVRGKWESDGDGYHWTYNCSICGWKDGYPFNERHKFCPNCGAKMGGTP